MVLIAREARFDSRKQRMLDVKSIPCLLIGLSVGQYVHFVASKPIKMANGLENVTELGRQRIHPQMR